MTDIKSITPFPPAPAETGSGGKDGPTRDLKIEPLKTDLGRGLKGGDPLSRAAQIVEAHLNEVTGVNKKLRLEKNEAADRFVYKIIDTETEQVIRQFPPEKLLKLIAYYRKVEGLSVDDTV